MRYREIGDRQEKIPVIGQGCGGYLASNHTLDIRRIEALRSGIELGLTLIDTAEVYENGHSEEIVSRAIHGLRDRVFIATKVSPENLAFNDVLRAADNSLKRLKIECIDLYQIHWPNTKIPIEDTMRAVERLVKEGKIRYIGVSNFSLQQLREAQKFLGEGRIMSVQAEYNLLDRSVEENILPYCNSKGIVLMAYSPLVSGKIFSTGKKLSVLQEIARRYGKTIGQITLNWLVSKLPVVAIPKSVDPQHIRENAASLDFELDTEDLGMINMAFAPRIVEVPTERIRVVSEAGHQAYQTLEEALENKLRFTPGPKDLSWDILGGEFLKPVRVIETEDKTGQYEYDLIEGRVRYWAWVIAHRGKKPIPVYVRDF